MQDLRRDGQGELNHVGLNPGKIILPFHLKKFERLPDLIRLSADLASYSFLRRASVSATASSAGNIQQILHLSSADTPGAAGCSCSCSAPGCLLFLDQERTQEHPYPGTENDLTGTGNSWSPTSLDDILIICLALQYNLALGLKLSSNRNNFRLRFNYVLITNGPSDSISSLSISMARDDMVRKKWFFNSSLVPLSAVAKTLLSIAPVSSRICDSPT
jgi:hypothetical protein